MTKMYGSEGREEPRTPREGLHFFLLETEKQRGGRYNWANPPKERDNLIEHPDVAGPPGSARRIEFLRRWYETHREGDSPFMEFDY